MDRIAEAFQAHRERLRGVAFRLLGSLAEADDAVQEAWLRLRSAETDEIQNFGGWLTTVVSRVALDMLRARKSRREAPLLREEVEPVLNREARIDSEQEALLAEAVGIGLMVVLDQLEPAERLAFVLHDLFGVSFEEIAPVVGRSEVAARQLASRARRRLRGLDAPAVPSVPEQRRLVSAFFAASRDGNFEALLEILDPGVTLRADPLLLPAGAPNTMHEATTVAKRALVGASRARFSEVMLVNGAAGIVDAPYGHLRIAMMFVVAHGRIQEIEVVAEPQRLARLRLALLDEYGLVQR